VDAQKWVKLRNTLTGKNEEKKVTNYVKVIYAGNDKKGLAIRKKASWDAKPTQYVKVGTVFTVKKKVSVGDGDMYELKSGLFITASNKYVKYFSS